MHNGIALYLTWVLLSFALNTNAYLIYDLGVEMNKSSLIILSVICFLLFTYCILENFIWQKYLIYVITPWFVVILNNAGILIKNWVQSYPSRTNLASLLLLVITFFFTFIKIIMFIFEKLILLLF